MSRWFTAPMTKTEFDVDADDFLAWEGRFSLNTDNLAAIRWVDDGRDLYEAVFRVIGEPGITYTCADRDGLEVLIAYFRLPLGLPGRREDPALEGVEAVG